MQPQAAVTACLMAGMSGIILALGFLLAEPRSPVARAVALFYCATGFAIGTDAPLILIHEADGSVPWLMRYPIFDTLLFWAAGLWVLRLARMSQPTPRALLWVTACVWSIWLAAIAVTALNHWFPMQRSMDFFVCLGRPQGCGHGGFWTFSLPWTVLVAAALGGASILSAQGVDPAERVRATSLAAAIPFLAGGLNLPMGYHALSMMLGYVIYTLGMIRYYSMQGERAQFLSRFLSPEVGQLVRYRGFERVMRPKILEITAVSCDMRGFTRLSQLLASDQVVRLLNEYYEAIGAAVAEFGGTIKEYSGDGALILVGAPLPMNDHAARGIALGHRLQQVAHDVIGRWAGPEMELGIGVGIGSGKVTVGAIGNTRMEYTAIGPAVNMAARLCAQAKDGEILLDTRTAELAGAAGLEPREALPLKGFGDTPHYAAVMA